MDYYNKRHNIMRHKVNNNNQSRETNITFFEKAYSSAVKEGMLILGDRCF